MSSRYQYYDRLEREAVERLDVLEEEIPRENCSVKGCERHGRYEWGGTFGTRWLCNRHVPLYRRHTEILRRIRAIPSGGVVDCRTQTGLLRPK